MYMYVIYTVLQKQWSFMFLYSHISTVHYTYVLLEHLIHSTMFCVYEINHELLFHELPLYENFHTLSCSICADL